MQVFKLPNTRKKDVESEEVLNVEYNKSIEKLNKIKKPQNFSSEGYGRVIYKTQFKKQSVDLLLKKSLIDNRTIDAKLNQKRNIENNKAEQGHELYRRLTQVLCKANKFTKHVCVNTIYGNLLNFTNSGYNTLTQYNSILSLKKLPKSKLYNKLNKRRYKNG